MFFSKNVNNSESEVVLLELKVAAKADLILQGWGLLFNSSNMFLSDVILTLLMAANMINVWLWQCFSAGQSYLFSLWLERSSRSDWGGRRRPWTSAGLWGMLYFSHSSSYLSTSLPTFFSPLQLVNNGPSVVSQCKLEVKCLLRASGHRLLYPAEILTEGPLSCSSKTTFNPLKLKVRTHNQTTWQFSSWL